MNFLDKYENGSWTIESEIRKDSFGAVYKISKDVDGVKSFSALRALFLPLSSFLGDFSLQGIKWESMPECLGKIVDGYLQSLKFIDKLKGAANIVSYEDCRALEMEDEIGYVIVFRMELLDRLEDVIAEKDLGEMDAVKLGLDICGALEAIEETQPLIIEPDSIMISKQGDYKLGRLELDGDCLLWEGRTFAIDDRYLAPNRLASEDRVLFNLYSLGLVMYQITNGKLLPFMPPANEIVSPFIRREAIERRLSGEKLPPPSNASKELADIILKACAYNEKERYQSVAEMKNALLEYMSGKI
ncbi:MAG: hypothetical protein LBT59_06275 [Clostridiales bacterium]|nr:hypothetical protein [Clostridiales bacterium]